MFRRRRRRAGSTGMDRLEKSIESQLKEGSSASPNQSLVASPLPKTHKTHTTKPPKLRERVHKDPHNKGKGMPAVEPAKDQNGNVLTVDEILESLYALFKSECRLDHDAKKNAKDPEQQANRAKNLGKKYKAKRRELDDLLRKAKRHHAAEREAAGFRSYDMATPERDEAMTRLVDETVAWFHDQVDRLKDEVGDKIRAGLDELGDEANDVKLRERLYREMTSGGIISNWEPLEF